MSFLGATVDAFLSTVTAIVNVIFSITTTINDFITMLLNVGTSLITIFVYLSNLFILFISLITDFEFIGFMIISLSFYYAAFTCTTRKDLLNKTGKYYYHMVIFISKFVTWFIQIVVRIVNAIIDII